MRMRDWDDEDAALDGALIATIYAVLIGTVLSGAVHWLARVGLW